MPAPHDHAQMLPAIRTELRAAQVEFHALLDAVADDGWRRPSNNPGWTNGEILFHMALGFFLLPTLLPMVRLLGRFPHGVTRPFAACLHRATGSFNRVNAVGARIGGRVLRRQRLARTFDWAMARILRMVSRVDPAEWQRGMYYPTRWDALFSDYMTLEKLLRYPIAHLRFHTDQLSASHQRPPRA